MQGLLLRCRPLGAGHSWYMSRRGRRATSPPDQSRMTAGRAVTPDESGNRTGLPSVATTGTDRRRKRPKTGMDSGVAAR
ncbi:hypothetical protein GWI33_016771 [Rhynchophorus ferrugineus]|uniref:Uncharacterized protein n=1 Tax=Rhynchophorus ferrugineus TaxID=354439 RepID=A0A834I307_RHYFE|nr:hypothetical protein GWI33_016771 [Rhynchophorus ferrugineus]